MKKLLAVLLAFAMVFAFAACGEQAEPASDDAQAVSTIDLGGGLGECTLEGGAFGNYEVIETPDEFVFEEGSEITVYADTECDTPYIVVYRFAKGEDTLETLAQREADLYSEGYYQMYEGSDNFPGGAYMCTYNEYDGNYYYIDSQYVEDGDDFVVVDCYAKTEELEIGDTDVYAWVPVGYTNIMTQDDIDHGSIFWGEYSDDYYFPEMWIGKWDSSYEYLNWYWENEFPDGVPYTEKEYADAIAKMESDNFDTAEYYNKMQTTIDFDSNTSELCKYDYNGQFYSISGIWKGDDIWFQIGDDWYNACFASELDPEPAYAGVFLHSLHTK